MYIKGLFTISSKYLAIDEFKEVITIEPDLFWHKGDVFKKGNREHIKFENLWGLKNKYDLISIDDVAKDMIDKIKDCVDPIIKMSENGYRVDMYFIVVEEDKNEPRAILVLEKEQMMFFAKIGASISIEC